MTVMDGQTTLGFILRRRGEYEAFDQHERSLGLFLTAKAAADAISAEAAP